MTPENKRGCVLFAAGCATVIVLALIGLVALRLTFKGYTQRGVSMEPTLFNGDRVVVRRRPDEIRRGDLIAFRSPRDRLIMLKRVIGLPGDVVEMRNSGAIVNGTALHEPYIQRDPTVEAIRDLEPFKVPPNHYYVLGDNRDHSNDSRYLGSIKRADITGKAIMIVSRAGDVTMLP